MDNNIRIRLADLSDKTHIENLLKEISLRGDDILVTNSKYWIAETEDHNLVGSAGLEFGVDAVLLRSVAVSPDFRGQGLGHSLVNTAASVAKAMGYKTIFVCSVSSGGYWQKMGFRKIPAEELVRALPDIPQVLRFTKIGKLATETGWKKELT